MCSAFCNADLLSYEQAASWESGGCNLIIFAPAPAPGLVGANSPGGSRRLPESIFPSRLSSGSLGMAALIPARQSWVRRAPALSVRLNDAHLAAAPGSR